jgi:beta-phosphoglucomutase-like phosphatase (HAD superfamily)
MKAVIFDVDGTLTDSVHLHAKAWQETLRHFGYSIPFHVIRSQMGKGGDQVLPAFLTQRELESKGDEMGNYRAESFRRNFLPRVKPFAKVRELFERLIEDEWKIALASLAQGEDLEVYKEICRISDLWNVATSANNAGQTKPFRDFYQEAMISLEEIPVRDCIIVGDSPYDATVAARYRIRSVGFLSGGFPEADLVRSGFDMLHWGTPDLYRKYEESIFWREAPCRQERVFENRSTMRSHAGVVKHYASLLGFNFPG